MNENYLSERSEYVTPLLVCYNVRIKCNLLQTSPGADGGGSGSDMGGGFE